MEIEVAPQTYDRLAAAAYNAQIRHPRNFRTPCGGIRSEGILDNFQFDGGRNFEFDGGRNFEFDGGRNFEFDSGRNLEFDGGQNFEFDSGRNFEFDGGRDFDYIDEVGQVGPVEQEVIINRSNMFGTDEEIIDNKYDGYEVIRQNNGQPIVVYAHNEGEKLIEEFPPVEGRHLPCDAKTKIIRGRPETFVHRQSPIIIRRPPTRVLIPHPPIVVQTSPIIYQRDGTVVKEPVIHRHLPRKVKVHPYVVEVEKPVEKKIIIDNQIEKTCGCNKPCGCADRRNFLEGSVAFNDFQADRFLKRETIPDGEVLQNVDVPPLV